MNFLITLLPSLPFAALICAFGFGGYLIGRANAAYSANHKGRLAGMREERCRANARIIAATVNAYHEGVITERNRRDLLSAGCIAASRN